MKFHFLRSGIMSLAVLMLSSCHRVKPENEISLSETIKHDDFEYSITDFKVTDTLGTMPVTRAAEGFQYYVVSFLVQNHALRAEHQWDNTIAYIKDSEGNEYENNTTLQKKLNETEDFGWTENYTTPAGSSRSVLLVFELPDQAPSPCLMVHGLILAGDIMNGTKFRKKRIRLY